MKKKLAVVNSENIDIVEAILNYFQNKNVEVTLVDKVDKEFDLNVLTGFEVACECFDEKVLNIYPALLPAFKGEEPIKDAFLTGVKVSGVTVHEVNSGDFYGRILAQYPVLIGTTMHITELQSEIIAIAKKLYPVVIDSVLNDKVFDFSDLFKSSCHGNCGGCGNCNQD